MHIKIRLKRALKRLCRIRNYTAATNQLHIDLTQFEFNMLKSIHQRDEDLEQLGDVSKNLQECTIQDYIMRLMPVLTCESFIGDESIQELQIRSKNWKKHMRDKTAHLKEMEEALHQFDFQKKLQNKEFKDAVQALLIKHNVLNLLQERINEKVK